MTDDQLLEQLQRQNLIDAQAVTRLKRDALIKAKPVESIIDEERAVPSEKIAELKSSILNIPYQKVDPEKITPELLNLIPEETARSYGVLPLALQDNLLVAGMVHPDDPKAQEALKFIARRSRYNLGVYVIAYADWETVLRKYSPYRSEIARAVQSLNVKEGSSMQKTVKLEDAMAGDEAPVIKIVADTLKEAVFNKASDVHIEPQEKGVRIRFRIDGDLHQVAMLPPELGQPVISRVKVISSMKIDETRTPQDGRFRSRIMDKEVDFRVSTFPTPMGEKVAIRVLDPATGLKDFEKLPFQYKNSDIVRKGIEKPYGMILITGPTGSGKTTTLYAFLQKMNQEDVNIVSLEDPVEYFVSGINQSQVRPEIGYTFASGLREIVRQDPDIIMVGEIRDAETAGLAVQAALTGHIVLSTLHTNNAAGVIPRLIDLKVEPFLLPVSLNLMIAQRLVGTLCPDCKAPETALESVQQLIENALGGLPEEVMNQFPKPYQIYHAKGCATCKGHGVVGRMAIYEVFEMTPAIEEIVASGALTTQKIINEAKKQGMLTLRQDGVLKALRGLVSMEEVIRETEEV